MNVRTIVGCGALVAVCSACSSNKPAEEPANYTQTEVTAPEAQGTPETNQAQQWNMPGEPGTTEETTNAEEQRRTQAPSQTGTSESNTEARAGAPAPQAAAPSGPTAPDNTGVNKRDRGDTTTPMKQGNSQEDLRTTQQIRKAVMADDSLSFSAKNVKIITSNGKVTLRGVVNSDDEKKTIDDEARKVAGPANVDDQIEVKQ